MQSVSTVAAHATDGVQLGDQEFAKIAVYAKKHFGLSLSDNKKPLVRSRLSRRLRSLKIGSFSDYLDILDDVGSTEERTELLCLLTTNVTQFFREAHHFETLRNEVLPPLVDAAQNGARVRLWSAGCSTGPEPYSIAIVLHALCPNAHKLDIKVLGTDIDPVVLRQAIAAEYGPKDLAQIPKIYANIVSGGGSSTPRLPDEVTSLVRFGTLNLIKPFPFSGKFDAIFCRNVAIYFDKETQQDVWTAFSNALKPNGFLFLGHSERLSGPALQRFRGTGITTYQKVS